MPGTKLSVDDLRDFENEIADLFAQGKIKAPVHLRQGREQFLIDIFEQNEICGEDYVYAYWDSHELALLKGVPREDVKQAILQGRSIALCFPEYKLMCSGIVGSLLGAAVGTAWALKKNDKPGRVFSFCGDMSSETGIFHEAVKYAAHFKLPVTFVVSDNGLSVMTPTREVWGSDDPWFKDTRYAEKIIHFQYKNEYPHSGLGWKIKF
ncbi:MAG: thiamine pyrophosphate-dependent enzyme [Candidatus Omnitrophota bacterium]